jgi:hypothetical protein
MANANNLVPCAISAKSAVTVLAGDFSRFPRFPRNPAGQSACELNQPFPRLPRLPRRSYDAQPTERLSKMDSDRSHDLSRLPRTRARYAPPFDHASRRRRTAGGSLAAIHQFLLKSVKSALKTLAEPHFIITECTAKTGAPERTPAPHRHHLRVENVNAPALAPVSLVVKFRISPLLW